MISRLRRKLDRKKQRFVLSYKSSGVKGVLFLLRGSILYRFGIKKHQKSVDENLSFLYPYILTEENPVQKKTKRIGAKTKVINWIITDFDVGSGGHTTIFRTIQYLEQHGFTCNIYNFGPLLGYKDAVTIKNIITKHFMPLKAQVFVGIENLQTSDATIATSWFTAYALKNVNNTQAKLYFVQDYEPYFYPMSTEYILAKNTYELGFTHICASKWLADTIKKVHSGKADYFLLGADATNATEARKDLNEKSVTFYGRWISARRGYDLGMLALQKVKKQMPDVTINVYGWLEDKATFTFDYNHVGLKTRQELATLYQSSTVGLSLSLTNVSLIPFEMMAQGLCVVETNHPAVIENFIHKKNILVSRPDPNAIAENILLALSDDALRKRIAKSSQHKVLKQYNWEKSFAKIHKIIESTSK